MRRRWICEIVASRRSLTLVVVASVASFLLGGGGRATMALFTDNESDPSMVTTAVSFGGPTTYHYHNDPTPPTADTNSRADLSMDTTAPTATVLRNYDQNRNPDAGLTILKGGSGAAETDLTRYQNWLIAVPSPGRAINGTITVTFWSGMRNFGLIKRGAVTVFLRDFDPATSAYTTIASGTLTEPNWQGLSITWVQKTLTLTASNYSLASGHRLELKLIVDGTADDDMWFAYDTTAYPSRVTVP